MKVLPSSVIVSIHANPVLAYAIVNELSIVDENVGKKPMKNQDKEFDKEVLEILKNEPGASKKLLAQAEDRVATKDRKGGKKTAPKPVDEDARFKLDEISPEMDEMLEEKNQLEMERLGMKPVRNGRADTGVQVFGPKGVPNAEVGQLIRDLLAQGYLFVDAHYRGKPLRDHAHGRQTGERKVVITFVFSREPDEESQDADFVDEVLAYFAGRAWRTVHVWWKNPSGVDTVNLVGGFDAAVGRYRTLHFNPNGEYSLEETFRHSRANA